MGILDGFNDLNRIVGRFDGVKTAKACIKLTRDLAARSAYKKTMETHGAEVAEAVAAAVRAGRSPEPIIDQANRMKREQAEREELLRNPPPVHGSARWATTAELGTALRDRSAFDDPRSILLGSVLENGSLQGFLHWDDDGHLMTLAPTRTGKAMTSIVPNLLRYQGSCVVLDPKGELYELTSHWRRSLGPVYRINPFNEGQHPGKDAFPKHGFNPLAHVRRYIDARNLAAQLFPRDPKGQDFFTDEAHNFIAPLIWFLVQLSPPELRTMRALGQAVGANANDFRSITLEAMLGSGLSEVAAAAESVLKKFGGGNSLQTFFNTLDSKLGFWRDPDMLASLDRDDVDFSRLMAGSGRPGETETVYVTVPFDFMESYAPFLRCLFLGALDGARRNTVKPAVQGLFVMDEFLAMGPFPEFQAAIRTHASYGVRLWFILQDLGTLQWHYPGTTWQAFFNTSVKLFFGTDDQFTGEMISNLLSNQTLAVRTTNSGANVSTQMGGDNGSAGVNFSGGESVSLMAKPLLMADEVTELLSPWLPDGSRHGIVKLRTPPRPVQVRLVSYENSETCMARKGALTNDGGKA